MPLRPKLIRIVPVEESRNLPLQLLGHTSRVSDKPARQTSQVLSDRTITDFGSLQEIAAVHDLIRNHIASGTPLARDRLPKSSLDVQRFAKSGLSQYSTLVKGVLTIA